MTAVCRQVERRTCLAHGVRGLDDSFLHVLAVMYPYVVSLLAGLGTSSASAVGLSQAVPYVPASFVCLCLCLCPLPLLPSPLQPFVTDLSAAVISAAAALPSSARHSLALPAVPI